MTAPREPRRYRLAIDRRQFLQRAIAAGAGAAVIPSTMVAAQSASPGPSPYGDLATEPDANGLLLPDGFTYKVIAIGGEPVGDTEYAWHAFPDGAATFPTEDGGWIYACNSEVTDLFAPDQGGVSAIRFDADGGVVDAYPILEGSRSNCAGGPTPWGTWMSCEEPLDSKGRLWECDPTGEKEAVAHEAMGIWRREAAAVDPDGKAVYMTEDDGIGLLYRYTPTAYPDLSEGLLEAAIISTDGAVTWGEIPYPSAASEPTNSQLSGAERFNGGEGIWFHDGTVYFTSKGDNRVHAIDLAEQQYRLIWESNPDEDGVEGAVLSGVDNITVDDATGDLFVAEDGGDMELVIITPDGAVAPFLRAAENPNGSEITGPCLSPDRSRLYFSSQRESSPKGLDEIIPGCDKTAKIAGITYEITGPFRAATAEPASPTTTLAKADPSSADGGSDGGSNDGGSSAPLVIGAVAVLAAAGAGATIALRRRRDHGAATPADTDTDRPDDPSA